MDRLTGLTILLSVITAGAAMSGCASDRQGVQTLPPASSTTDRGRAVAEKVVYSFMGGNDGEWPVASLLDVHGTLYGTTHDGGSCTAGTIFSISNGAETVVHTFCESDGANPSANLINVGGVLFGTTLAGGATARGTVFKMTISGSETVIYSFKGHAKDGAFPSAALIDVGDKLYGTTTQGGMGSSGYGEGTAYAVTTSGKEKMLYAFRRSHGDDPKRALVYANNALYGTTPSGGAHTNGLNGGTGFELSKSGAEKTLYSFAGSNYAGRTPDSPLVEIGDLLYGTTQGGGAHGVGTVFSMTTSGKVKTLYSFAGGSDGADPVGSVLDVKGVLYGTTSQGGKRGNGTVFSITTSGKESVLYRFAGTAKGDGANPQAGLIEVNGILYGTTAGGGVQCLSTRSGCGTVFSLVL